MKTVHILDILKYFCQNACFFKITLMNQWQQFPFLKKPVGVSGTPIKVPLTNILGVSLASHLVKCVLKLASIVKHV